MNVEKGQPTLTQPAECDTIVLGAGVVGVATAYALARRGVRVCLVDRAASPAMGTSFANGAQLSYAYSDTLGSPSLLKKLPGLVFGADPLFRVEPSLDPDFIRWGLDFLKSCTASAQISGTLATLALALESQGALHALLARHPIEFGHSIAGKMHLYFDSHALNGAAGMVARKQAQGVSQHILGRAEAIAIEPTLKNAKGLEGVIYSPEDEVGDPHRFSVGLSDVLTQHYGMQTRFGFTARSAKFESDRVIVTGDGGEPIKAKNLVVALGIDAPAFLARIGISVRLQPLKGYSFTAPPGAEPPHVSLTDTSRKLVFCNLSGRMRIAGVAELGNWNTQMDATRLGRLIKSARESLPGAADYDRLDSSWAGLRPMSANSVPIIARPRPGLVLNIGHGMLGWTLAMGAGERAAALAMQTQ